MARLTILFFSLIFAQVSLSAETLEAESGSFKNLLRNKPGFAAEIPMALCQKTYPSYKVIVQKLPQNKIVSSYNLFAFTASKFDPNKPSVLYVLSDKEKLK